MNPGPTRALVTALALSVVACTSNTVVSQPSSEGTPTPAPTDAPEQPAPTPGQAAYPGGPYGNAVGSVLGDFELVGYRRNDTNGLATAAGLAPLKLSEVRANAGEVKYAVLHVSAFWCGICRAAVEDMVAQYPKLAKKAIFVDLLVEGKTPSDFATQPNLDSWVKGLSIPYTVGRDPDGVEWRIRSQVGKNKTALLVELSTMKVLAKSATDYSEVLEKLEAAP